MDYKKLYEKAVERAKTLTNSGFNDFDFVKHIFPELTESEDEEIRKAIYNCVKWFGFDSCFFKDVSQKECLAWLKKQGEKLPVGFYYVNSEGKKFYSDTFKYGNVILHVEKQGEQKSAEFKPSFRVGDVIKPKDPVLGEPRIIKGIHPKFGYGTNNGILDFEYEDNWEAVEEPVSDELEEASKNYALNNTPWDDCKDEIQEAFKAGAKWQKEKDESTTEDLGEYINELSKQFPEVSFAKLSRIAVRVAKWQEQKYKEALNIKERKEKSC